MADQTFRPDSGSPTLFAERRPEPGGSSPLPWLVSAAVVLLLVLLVFLFTLHKGKPAPAGVVPYAASLVFSDLQLSESSALSGVKVTYVDGHLHNIGKETVTAATVAVAFDNDEQLPPQMQTVPVSLVRTHEPYVDIQPISAAPLGPGQEAEFRLVFEDVASNWNQHLPVIRLTSVTTR